MRRIIERKKITSRVATNSENLPHLRLPTYNTRRTDDIIERLAIPEAQNVANKESITQQDSQFLTIFSLPRVEKPLERKKYINDQVFAEKIENSTECIKCILARKHIIHDQEAVIPYFLEEINRIKNTTLHHAFMDKFYIPHTLTNNSLVVVLKSNEEMEKRVEWLEHKYLEAQAKLLECGEKWLLLLKSQYILFRLGPYDWRGNEKTTLLPSIMELPSNELDSLINFFREELLRTPPVEIRFKSPADFIEPMKIFQLQCQMKNKNAVYMEKTLSEKKGILLNLQEKTNHVSSALLNDLRFVEQELAIMKINSEKMEKQSREILVNSYDLCAKEESRIDAVVAVDSLVEYALHCNPGNRQTGVLIRLLETRLQNLFDAIFLSMKPGDETQLQMEKMWIEKEKRELNNAKKAHIEVLRMRKLERKLRISLSPPNKKSSIKLPLMKSITKKKTAITIEKKKKAPLSMETSYCFESDVDIQLVSKFYQPAASLVALNRKDNPLTKSWSAVDGFTPVEDVYKSRKSTESILDLLENRSSYDFILSNVSNSIGNAERRDVEFHESDDNTSAASEYNEAFN